MKLERWALLAEVVSGLAVLVTLVILVIGVRDGADVTRAAVYENLMSDLNEFNLALINDPALSALWLGDPRLAELSEQDASRLVLMNRVIYRIFEAAYFSFRNGSLERSQWSRFESTICQTRRGRDPELWPRTTTILTDEFQAYIETSCE